MMLEQEYPVVGNWLFLHFAENKGMAFGFEFAGVAGKYLLSGIRILAVLAIVWFIVYLNKRRTDRCVIVALSFICAGALGNIIDSAFYGMIFSDSFGQYASLVPWGEGYAPFLQGAVVDMFYLELANFHLPDWFPFWPHRHVILFRPVFNIADIAITGGVIVLLGFRRKTLRKTLMMS